MLRSSTTYAILNVMRTYVRRPFVEPTIGSDTDYAWAAGFFDGEGHIAHQPRGGIQLIVVQVVREPLEFLCTLFGGTIYDYPKHSRWVLQRREYVQQALVLMSPYARIKGL